MSDQTKAVTKLTALWALSESGLGGFMHAFKIPFTGFFLGGFAIVIITLLAGIAKNKSATILQATLLVVLVKAAASPHSPPMAYIAVSFQGLAGALFYGLIPSTKIAGPVFGAIALFESAIQKFLVMTLIFGKSVWEALDLFVNGILKDFQLASNFSFSYWVMGLYTTLYVIWGFVLGWWSTGLWTKLNVNKSNVINAFDTLRQGANSTDYGIKNKKKFSKLWSAFFVLLFIVSVFGFNNLGGKAGYAVLRTIAALLFIWFILNPLFKWMIAKWVKRKKAQEQKGLTEILSLLPELKNYLQPAYEMAKQKHTGIVRYQVFVMNLITLALFKHDE
ncbi:MAG: hypothetical protein ACK5UI_05815 [Bacteroidota bacterium]